MLSPVPASAPGGRPSCFHVAAATTIKHANSTPQHSFNAANKEGREQAGKHLENDGPDAVGDAVYAAVPPQRLLNHRLCCCWVARVCGQLRHLPCSRGRAGGARRRRRQPLVVAPRQQQPRAARRARQLLAQRAADAAAGAKDDVDCVEVGTSAAGREGEHEGVRHANRRLQGGGQQREGAAARARRPSRLTGARHVITWGL